MRGMLQVRDDVVGLRLYFRGGMNYLKDKVSTGPISLMRNNGILKVGLCLMVGRSKLLDVVIALLRLKRT